VEFLGIGYQEILLVFVLMLVVVGPQRMPAVAYQIGKAVRTLQKYARAVRDEFSEELDYIDEQYRGLRDEIETTSASIREEQNKLQTELETSRASLQNDVDSSLRDTSSALQVKGNATAGSEDGSRTEQLGRAGHAGDRAEAPDGEPLVF